MFRRLILKALFLPSWWTFWRGSPGHRLWALKENILTALRTPRRIRAYFYVQQLNATRKAERANEN